MTKHIFDYFADSVDYPNNIAEDPIPYGVCWNYISNTFLNGFINYVKPIAIYAIDRYTPDDEEITVDEHDDKMNWKKTVATKKEIRDRIINGTIQNFHTDLHILKDDLIVLAKLNDSTAFAREDLRCINLSANKYMFFWFDCDVSDCIIGRFFTDDSSEEVIASVEAFMEDGKKNDNGIVNYHRLPLEFFTGWLKF